MAHDRTERRRFLQHVARLHAIAQQQGDVFFATALAECLIGASGGTPGCPIADVLLEEYAQVGHLPTIEDALAPPTVLPLPYDPQRLLNYLHQALEKRALLDGDTRYVRALQVCDRARRESESCPMRRFDGED